ncbi:hypothetical protein BD779DRAFT_1791714 [Infundibulicybe gibba]|nr:hypothetical protein BD779DRAFT_1791714 [Infundibulicybe gibba]
MCETGGIILTGGRGLKHLYSLGDLCAQAHFMGRGLEVVMLTAPVGGVLGMRAMDTGDTVGIGKLYKTKPSFRGAVAVPQLRPSRARTSGRGIGGINQSRFYPRGVWGEEGQERVHKSPPVALEWGPLYAPVVPDGFGTSNHAPLLRNRREIHEGIRGCAAEALREFLEDTDTGSDGTIATYQAPGPFMVPEHHSSLISGVHPQDHECINHPTHPNQNIIAGFSALVSGGGGDVYMGSPHVCGSRVRRAGLR